MPSSIWMPRSWRAICRTILISRPNSSAYFPRAAVARFPHELANHRLRREIIATSLANRIVNLAGPVFVHRMKEVSSAPAARVARALSMAEGAFGLGALKSAHRCARRTCRRADADRHVCRHRGIAAPARTVVPRQRAGQCRSRRDDRALSRRRRKPARHVRDARFALRSARHRSAHRAICSDAGVPLDIAEDVAVLPLLAGAPEIVHAGARAQASPSISWRAPISPRRHRRPRPPARTGGADYRRRALGPPRHPPHRRRSLCRPARACRRRA